VLGLGLNNIDVRERVVILSCDRITTLDFVTLVISYLINVTLILHCLRNDACQLDI